MSKKSRKRNKRLLALAGIITAGTLASRKKASDAQSKISVDSGRGGDSSAAIARANANKKTDYITKKDTSKSDVVAEPKKIVNTSRSRMMRPNPKAGGEAMGPNETRLSNAKNKMPDTAPPSIDNPYKAPSNIKGRFGASRNMKSGGRAGLKSGGSVKKSMGKALRGGGKVMR